MADIVIGKLVYEVTQVGLAQLKRQLAELSSMPLGPLGPKGNGRSAVSDSMRQISSDARLLRNTVRAVRNEFVAAGGDVSTYITRLDSLRQMGLRWAKDLKSGTAELAHVTESAAMAQRGIVSAVKATSQSVNPLTTDIARLQNQVHGLRNQYIAVGGSAEQFAVRMRRIRDEALQAAQGLSTTSKEFRQLQTVAAQAERAAVQATGGISRLGLASQVRAAGFWGRGGMGSVLASGVGVLPGRVGATAYFASMFARDLTRMNTATATATAGILALAGSMAIGTTQAAKLQKQQALLEAITVQSAGAYDELTRGIIEMSTVRPSSPDTLYEAAEVAAKLGIEGSQNILAFADAIHGLAYVTKGNVGQIGSDLAKFMNELGMTPASPTYLEDLKGVANALAAVHTTTAATADETLTLARYFAATGHQIGLTASEIISLSGALTAMGARAQSAGTNISKWFLEMSRAASRNSKELRAMAMIAGRTQEEFRELIRTDIVGAFVEFARGLGTTEGSAEKFAWALDAVGARNQRLITVLSQASVGLDVFLDALENVNAAQESKTYLDDVLAQSTKNLTDQSRLLWNTLSGLFALMNQPTVEWLTDRITRLREAVKELFDRTASLTEEQREAIAVASGLTLGLAGTVGVMSAMAGVIAATASVMRTFGLVSSIVFSPLILKAGLVALAVWGLHEAWSALKETQLPEVKVPDVDLTDWQVKWDSFKVDVSDSLEYVKTSILEFSPPSLEGVDTSVWEESWSSFQTSVQESLDEAKRLIEQFVFPDMPSLPDVDLSSWEQGWVSFQDRVKNSLGAVEQQIRDFELPPLPGIDQSEWEQRWADFHAKVQESLNAVEQSIRDFDLPPLPKVDHSEWMAGWTAIHSETRDALEITRNMIVAFEVPPLPSVDLSRWESDWNDFKSYTDDALEDVRSSVYEFEWPELPEFEWPEISVPTNVISEDEVEGVIRDAIERGKQSAFESPQGQAVLNIGEIASEVMAGNMTLKEAVEETLQRNLVVPLTAGIIAFSPLPTGWKITLTGAVLAIDFLKDAEIGLTGQEGVVADIFDSLKQSFESFLEDPTGDWALELREVPARILGWEFPDTKEEAEKLVEDLGNWIGQIAVYSTASLVALAYVIGKEIAVPMGFALAKGIASGILEALGNLIGIKNFVESPLMQEIRALLGTGPDEEGRVLLKIAQGERVSLEDRETFISPPPTFWQRIQGWWSESWLGRRLDRGDSGTENAIEIPAVLKIEDIIGIGVTDDILDAIWVAEGGSRARVPYGMTGFHDSGHRFLRDVNQERFNALVEAYGLVEGTEEYYRAAAATTVAWYWDTFKREFPEVADQTFTELAPEIQAAFIEHLGQFYAPVEAHPLNRHWIPNVKSELGLSGYQSGTRFTGWGPLDEVAGVVHRREAVIPWEALQKGPAGVLEFLGVPGFQDGRLTPEMAVEMARREEFRAQEVARSVESEAGTFLNELISLLGNLLESAASGLLGEENYQKAVSLYEELRSAIDVLLSGSPVSAVSSRVGGDNEWSRLMMQAIGLGMTGDEARDWVDSQLVRQQQQATFDILGAELFAIESELAHALGDRLEVEQLLASVTGQSFDELTYRIDATSAAIAEMVEKMFDAGLSIEEMAEHLQPFSESLEELLAQQRRQAIEQQAVTSGLNALAAKLNEIDPLLGGLARSLRWDASARRLSFDIGTLVSEAVSFGIGLLFDLFDGARSALDRLGPMPSPGEDVLGIAHTFQRWDELAENQRKLEQERLKLVEQNRKITTGTAVGAGLGVAIGSLFGPLGMLFGGLLGGAAGRSVTKSSLEPQIKATEDEIRRLTQLIQDAKTDLIDALGISADNFARGIAGAFGAADVDAFGEQLGKSIRDQIRNAMVQVFIAQILEPQLTQLAEVVQAAFLEGTELDMDALDEQIKAITDTAGQLYERFDELGLTVEDTTESLRGMSRNIPSGFRVAQARFEATSGVPHLADGGVVVRPTLAVIGERGPEAVVPLDRYGVGRGDMVFTGPITVVANDPREFERQMRQYQRRQGLVNTGNPTGGGWRRG